MRRYAELVGEGSSRSETVKRLEGLVEVLIEQMLQPEVNGLERRK